MSKSIFTEATKEPDNNNLQAALDKLFSEWQEIRNYVLGKYPSAVEQWSFTSEKYGWSFRIKDKKRAILYMLPRDKFFKVALVFGQKASDVIFESNISEAIKDELKAAKVYAEGRGIRIDIKNEKLIKDVKTLIDIKLAH